MTYLPAASSGPAAFLSTPGPQGAQGPTGPTGATGPSGGGVNPMEKYGAGFMANVDPALMASTGFNPTANRVLLMRAIAPATGTLKTLQFPVVTASGNVRGVVYDAGQANSTLLTRLYDSGSVAVPTAGKWQNIGDPNVAVTKGQAYYLGVQFDNGTVSLGKVGYPAGAAGTGWLGIATPSGGVVDTAGTNDPGSFTAPSTILFSALGVVTLNLPIVCTWVT